MVLKLREGGFKAKRGRFSGAEREILRLREVGFNAKREIFYYSEREVLRLREGISTLREGCFKA